MDSVNLINALVAQDSLTSEEQDTVDRNVEHLQLMVAKDYWTTEDLTPFNMQSLLVLLSKNVQSK